MRWLHNMCVYSLQSSNLKTQTRIGLLILLCTWLSNCGIAVIQFLNHAANIPFVSFLVQLHFLNCLCMYSVMCVHNCLFCIITKFMQLCTWWLKIIVHILWLSLKIELKYWPMALFSHIVILSFIQSQLSAQVEQNTDKEGDKLVRGLCALLLGICIAYHDGSSASYTKYVNMLYDQLKLLTVYSSINLYELCCS